MNKGWTSKALCKVGKATVYVHTKPFDKRRYSMRDRKGVILHKVLFDDLPFEAREPVAKAIHAMEKSHV